MKQHVIWKEQCNYFILMQQDLGRKPTKKRKMFLNQPYRIQGCRVLTRLSILLAIE